MESTNGTRVNGRRAKRWVLSDGDRITVGATSLTFVQKDMLGQAPAPGKPAVPAPVRRRRRR